MLPAGWMPDAHALVICSTSLSPVIHYDGGGKPSDNNKHQAAHQDCAFAAAAHLAAAPEAPHLALRAFHAFATRATMPVQPLSHRASHPDRPAPRP